MKKYEVLKSIVDTGVVAVIRAKSKAEGEKIIDAVKAGGIKAIEVTLTVPNAVEIIRELTAEYQDELIIGAGTVLDQESARMCILAGAKYIVSPCFDLETAKLCNRYVIPYLAGVMTPKEVKTALEYGVPILKVFPGGAFGPSIIKNFSGPLPQGSYMPTGGVSVENAKDWIKAGAVAVGAGSILTKGVKDGDYTSVTTVAKDLVNEVAKARKEMEK